MKGNQYTPPVSVAERLWSKVDFAGPVPPDPWAPIVTPCWLWQGHVGSDGYPTVITFNGRSDRRSPWRIAYELMVGPIPDGMQVDHMCRVRDCVNPEHLEPVTRRQNRRRSADMKTHCIHGHEFNEDNTRWRPSGGRTCRTCARKTTAAWRMASKLGAD